MIRVSLEKLCTHAHTNTIKYGQKLSTCPAGTFKTIKVFRKELPDLTYLHKVVVELGTAGLTEGPDALDRTHIQLSLFTNDQRYHTSL